MQLDTESLQMAAQRWIDRDPDPQTRMQIAALLESQNTDQLAALFEGRLSFGTAGLRALVGPGPLRMNRLVIRETTAGLAKVLAETTPDARQRGVVVAYDARPDSQRFAFDAAGVLLAAGFVVHLFDDVLPTPLCAFAVKTLQACGGITVTASHNPPTYNGYKVFDESGAQIVPPRDHEIAAAIADIAAASHDVACEAVVTHAPHALLRWHRADSNTAPDDALVSLYLNTIHQAFPPHLAPHRQHLRVAYTPLHGVGAAPVETLLAMAGIENVHLVASQRQPDGRFPTVAFPNPEEPGAMDALLALAETQDADVALANDPDADRLAAAVRGVDGGYHILSGDQLGILLADQCMQLYTGNPENAALGATLVSSSMIHRMAKARGFQSYETLTGFKWLAAERRYLEAQGTQVLFAYEEALGYCVGDTVPDKDGVSALLAFLTLAGRCAARGQTVLDHLQSLYTAYGLHLTAQRTMQLTRDLVDRFPHGLGAQLRAEIPSTLGSQAITRCDDLLMHPRLRLDGSRYPASDVMVLYVGEDQRVVVRPSGTEPKMKFYYELREYPQAREAFAQVHKRAQSRLDALIATHQESVHASLGIT